MSLNKEGKGKHFAKHYHTTIPPNFVTIFYKNYLLKGKNSLHA